MNASTAIAANRRTVRLMNPRRGAPENIWPTPDSSEANSRDAPQNASTRPITDRDVDALDRPRTISSITPVRGGANVTTASMNRVRLSGSFMTNPASAVTTSAIGIRARTAL